MKALYARLRALESRPRRISAMAVNAPVTAQFAAETLDVLLAIGAMSPDAPRTLTVIQDGRIDQVAAAW